MTANYYAILGVAPTSEDVVIRAAYVALMRRYHPDANATPQAAERAKAITQAYAVLGDHDRRVDYDRRLRNGDDAYDSDEVVVGTEAAWLNKIAVERIAMLAAVMLLLLLPIYLIRYPLAVQEPPRLADASRFRAPIASSDPAATCISRSAHDLVREQLVRRAGQFQRGNRRAFAQLAADSFVRIDSTLEASRDDTGTVNCKALVVVLAPPGTQIAHGRTRLAAEMDFSLSSAPDAKPALILANADPMARQLATLSRIPRLTELGDTIDVREQGLVPRLAAAPSRPAPPDAIVRPPETVSSRDISRVQEAASPVPKASRAPIVASFNCNFAKRRGESAVCRNRNLAAVDRQLALFYGQSLGQSDAPKRAALIKSGERFIARRNACRSDACALNTYLGRMREVADIMAVPSQATGVTSR
ncbi:MAG TPA: DnaJ domain-containing protein [Sphingomicrobium sp.]|nr:DnaJ domain-containing protein [Sphingomicrobium sp.]